MRILHLSTLIVLLLLNTACSNAQKKNSVSKQKEIGKEEQITIGKKIKFYSELLGEEKEIFIALPHKYKERVHSYPVVFVLEAEFLFEPTNTIAKLMAARSKMPQSIVIGLANGEYEKRHEVGFNKWGGKSEQYLEFFTTELIPYIDENYRANTHRTIIGLSPSTGFLFETLLSGSDVFSGYIALSTHFEWTRIEEVSLIDEIIAKSEEETTPKSTLYMARADSDLELPVIKEAFEDAAEKLKNANPKSIMCTIEVLEKEEHYLMSLAGIRAGFASIYPDSVWKNPGWIGWDKNENYADSYYRKYFGALSKRYGFDIYPVEDGHSYGFYLTGKIYNAQRWGTNKQVIQLAELGTEYYPNSANLHRILAEAYKKGGKVDLALQTGKKAVALAATFHPDKLDYYKSKLAELEN